MLLQKLLKAVACVLLWTVQQTLLRIPPKELPKTLPQVSLQIATCK